MFGSRPSRQKMITLDDFLKETSLRRELRMLNVEFQLHDVREPRCFRPNVFKTSRGVRRYAARLCAEVRELTASITDAINDTR